MEVQAVITDIVNRLKQVKGLNAVVLGGSRARGTHTPNSDIDIGIYYSSGDDFDISALRKIATDIDDTHKENLLTEIGGWGPWVNGGGCLTVKNYAVDFLYRDLT
jgi:predicted nucleotidyltransferase